MSMKKGIRPAQTPSCRLFKDDSTSHPSGNSKVAFEQTTLSLCYDTARNALLSLLLPWITCYFEQGALNKVKLCFKIRGFIETFEFKNKTIGYVKKGFSNIEV